MTPKQWKRIFLRGALWSGIIVGCLLVIFLAESTWTMYGKERAAASANVDEAAALAELKARESSLSADVQNLDTPRGIEAEIRERYPVAKPGESVIVITPSQQTASNTAPEASSTPWSSFWSLFSWL